MTTEEKAKAYEMALEAARKELGVDRKEWWVVQRVLHNIFPQLRESEDERVRKCLIAMVNATIWDSSNLASKKACLAWLEKQKEQKELSLMDGNADLYFDEWNQQKQNPTKRQCFEEGMRYAQRLQKEQIPYTDFVIKPHKGDDNNPYDMSVSEAQEYAINRGFGIPFNDGEVYVDERHLTQTIGNILRWADEHPKEQKPAEWSEEDEDMLNSCISSIEEAKENRYAYKETDGDTSYDHEIAWLKSLRPPKDCSGCAKHLEGYISGRGDAENKLLDQFGILITPEGELHMKPRWKPSEEQMEALDRCVDYLDESDNEDAGIIESLYEQLKSIY